MQNETHPITRAPGTPKVRPPSPPDAIDHEVVVVGAGFSGIGAGIALSRSGFHDYAILESAEDLGGTWRDNTYPGIAVDIPSFTYSFSFAQNPRWSRVFAPGRELKTYADECADRYGVRAHMRFNTRVEKAVFDEEHEIWWLSTTRGPLVARYLISAVGGLTQPKIPSIPGIAEFRGKTMHTARWDHGCDLSGKRVAVIGTGASAVQVVPEIARTVGRLFVFQRTPIWILPKPDREVPAWLRAVFAAVPLAQRSIRLFTSLLFEILLVFGVIYHRQTPWLVRRIESLCRRHLERQVADPALRARLTPRYGFGCKRPSFSDAYYPALCRENVSLVTDPIAEITPTGVRTADGALHELDVLILATGFKVFEKGNTPPFEIVGRRGGELGQFWHEHRYQAYEGATVPGFPSLFLVLGPYSTTGSSWFSMVEAQTAHAVRCLAEARRRRAPTIEIKRAPHDAFFQDILRRQKSSLLFNNNCASANSYYFDHHGDAPFMRPSSGLELWWRSRHFDLDHYRFEPAPQKKARRPAPRRELAAAFWALLVIAAIAAIAPACGTKQPDDASPACALVACGEDCVDTTTDAKNCGACGQACSPAASCASSACNCPANFMPAAPTFSQTILREGVAQFPGLVTGVGLTPSGDKSQAVLLAFDPKTVPIGRDIDLATAKPSVIRVGFGYDVVALTSVRGGYLATSGVRRLSSACEHGISGALSNVETTEVDIFDDFAPIRDGCSLTVPSVSFSLGSCADAGVAR
jgi:cation diffusion facilitator CzcD-associated flavoprotein CzcO